MVRNRFNLFSVLIYTFMTLLGLLVLYPFYNSILISFTPQHVFLKTPFMLFPSAFTLDSYRVVFATKAIFTGLRATTIITIVGTFYNIFLTVALAYALNRPFPGNKLFMYMILFTMYFGGGLIPFYLLIMKLGMMDTLWAMILPSGISIAYMTVMRKYFRDIPAEIEESAKIDGANDIVILLRIILPISLPMVVTFTIYYGVERWNEWYNGLLFAKSAINWPLQLVLRDIIQRAGSSFASESMAEMGIVPYADGVKMACVVVTMLPIMCLYPFMQRYFVTGMMTGAVKG